METISMQARAAVLLGALLVAGFAPTGCNPNSIGRPCINANQNAAAGTQIASPALECPSRLCLIQSTAAATGQEGNSRNTCTAECESDDDCDAETKEYCQKGFRCAVATQVGRFCCKKFCVCADDLQQGFNATGEEPNVEVVTPHACDPLGDAIITCPNVTK
jgi:hypothetical protein